MRLILFNRTVRISWIGLGIYVLLMLLLCSLGMWQLGRSEQKKQLLQQQQIALQAEGIDLNRHENLDIEVLRYHNVTVSGHYDTEHQFLLDNQIVDGKNGYFVMTPFFIDGQKMAVLVNRGWLPLGQDRNTLPTVEVQTSAAQISGRINRFPGVGFKLKGAEIPTDHWPSVVQVIDSHVLAAKLSYPLVDFQLELDSSIADGYKREWKIVTPIPPEKHLAYAVQWFGLALTLTVLFIWISIKNRSEHTA
ncbi:MAG: hypothetical protein CTY19_00335 [Methylomonas sp.]|nr:MAG: hypothetical protein CTY19_00335 [Methylomonas sp.]